MSSPNLTSAQSYAKRKRVDSTTEVDVPAIRSSDFWFEDGNVVLQAQSKQFRVHRSVVARHSTVFRDMFSLPQPEGDDLLDGCPIVHVTDASKDWEKLFTILYNPETIYQSADSGNFDLDALSSILRLGKKYELDKLYDAALKRISQEIPVSLHQWVQKFGYGVKLPSPLTGKEVELLNTLLDLEIQPLLPVAYFLCIKSLTLKNILEVMLPSATHKVERKHFSSGLSQDSVRTLILGREATGRAMMEHTFGWLTTDSSVCSNCISKKRCANRMSELRDLFLSMLTMDIVDDVFEPVRELDLCGQCQIQIRVYYKVGCQKVWEGLPTYFGLPPWKDLK
ncbi:hypothetical protein GALMADRAFT_113452 [Galerina marginata CBS 339.88]|uniref:BTB domain-containing protein n=1 Tax=Galerina marginata (strain CBS 339.88) TaxID=685588 RepID=A0A067TJ90_GALM3|nr:hypothetical protein GALMADRAFT_113452 [Galerina marginata CBS 339.88]